MEKLNKKKDYKVILYIYDPSTKIYTSPSSMNNIELNNLMVHRIKKDRKRKEIMLICYISK